jgi:hypothetical protein
MRTYMYVGGQRLVPINGGPDLTIPTGDTPPGAVVGLLVTSPTPTELQADWVAPTTGGAVTHYEVDVDGTPHDWDLLSPPSTIGDLTPSTEYEIGVRAVGPGGAGPTTNAFGMTRAVSPTTPFEEVWDDMIASHSLITVRNTFAQYTGFQAAGYALADLVPGPIESQYDGQVFEGIRASRVRIKHNDVTVRGCLIEGGGTYGADYAPSGAAITGTIIEYTTFDGLGQDKAAIYLNAGGTNPQAIVRFCDIYGWTSGNLIRRGMSMEYTWIHDLGDSSVDGPHVTSGSIRGPNSRIYRCLGEDGGSAVFTVYFDFQPMFNDAIQESIMNGSGTNAPSYLITLKDDPNGVWDEGATGIKIINNYYGRDFQFGEIQGAPVPWGSDGNELSGNVDLITGDPI